MARNDVYLNINALSPADAVVTGQQDMTAATVPELVLGDTPTFNFLFTDNTNVWPSWAGNAAYTVTWALSDAVSGDFSPAATTGNATPITGGWSIVLPLNAYDLVGLLNTKRVSQPYPVTNLWQQIRVADPSGNEVTRAMFWTPIRYRAISDTQNTESASPTGGREVTVNNVNVLTTPTAAQFYAANPVPTSALGSAANGELLIGNGTGFTKATLTAGSGVSITNGSGSITISATDGDITLDDGTAASPSLHFTNDPDTGIYRPAANTLGISTSGVQRMYVDENGITTVGAGATFDGSVHAANGNANNPSLSFTSDQDTGFFLHQPNELGIALGGTQYATLTSTTFSITPVVTMASSLRVNGTTDSSSKDTGAIVTEGGLGVEKSATIGGNLTVSGTGNVGSGLSVSGVSVPTILGSDYTTNATAKQLTIVARQYGSTAEPEGFMVAETYSDATNNRIDVGGGNSAYNAATKITFNTASGVSTRTGTERGYIDSTGLTLSGNLTVSGTGTSTFGGTIRAGAGSGETLSAGSLDTAADIGIKSTQGIVQGAARIVTFTNGNLLLGTSTDGGQKLQVNGVLAAGTTGGDRITLSAVAATDQYFLAQNYWNDNGTENVATSARGSWRAVMRNATSNTFNIDWRAANAAAGTFTNLLSLDSSGNATFAALVKTKLAFEAYDGATADRWQLYTYTDKTFRWNYNGSGSDELSMDTSGNLIVAGSMRTGTPQGGTASAWKFGKYNTTAPSATGYVEVDIGGTLYKLLAST